MKLAAVAPGPRFRARPRAPPIPIFLELLPVEPSLAQPAAFDPLPYGETPRQDAFGRHWTSAEAYLRRCEERLRTAKESGLAATEASQAGAATRALLAVEYATRALQRAREYRDKAEVTARLARALPAGLR